MTLGRTQAIGLPRRSAFAATWLAAALLAVSTGRAEAPRAGVNERFAEEGVAETPDFQKHLVPLLGRLGCNGRACHGSFQGQGGFMLSLFGYDFAMDHEHLLDRVDVDDPANSYALLKPTLAEPHEGGQRLAPDSWEYRLFLNWIRGGAQGVAQPVKMTSLEVSPREIRFDRDGQQQPLRAIAVWPDGTREDVTCLSRFQSNDDAVCTVDEAGNVVSTGLGDSHIVVFYDNAVIPVPVLRPLAQLPVVARARMKGRTPIDRAIEAKLAKMGIEPSQQCTDEEFLRRVSLDISGTLPTARQVREFLADSAPDKRARKIDALLETPAYAAWWTTRLCDWTGCNDQQLNNANPVNNGRGSGDWYQWVYQRVADNMPYDDLAEGMILASGRRSDETYRDYCDRMSRYYQATDVSFADHEGLIYYWGRQNFRSTEDRAIGFAYTFMGARIQCAQCHKHPFDVWTKQDFAQFEKFFERINFARNGGQQKDFEALIAELGLEGIKPNLALREMPDKLKQGKSIPFPDVVVRPPRRGNRQSKSGEPAVLARLLGEQTVDLEEIADPRTALMDWLRNSPTRLFAKAFVNRVWANYFHRGIVDPTDDLSLANPPCNEELLDSLAASFIQRGYDMKWLHREICNSDAYQRSWRPNASNVHDERNFSRAVLRRLPAEVASDALRMAALNDADAEQYATELTGRGIANTSPPRRNRREGEYALTIFGRSIRENNCDCDRSNEVNLLQTVFTRNDAEVQNLIVRQNGWLWQQFDPADADALNVSETDEANLSPKELRRRQRNRLLAERAGRTRFSDNSRQQLAAAPRRSPNELIEDAYLRTLSRLPTDQERRVALDHLAGEEDAFQALGDLLWALMNTREFLINH